MARAVRLLPSLRGRRSRTAWHLEAADPGAPLGTPRRVVLARIPERAVVHRIDAHRAVVAPAIATALRGGAGDELGLLLEGVQRIAGQAGGVRQGREHPGAGISAPPGDAVAESDVAEPVHRDTSHPPVLRARGVRALLVNGPTPAALAKLVPADAGPIAADVDREVRDERLMVAEIAVREGPHRPLRHRIDALEREGLLDAVEVEEPAHGVGVGGDVDCVGAGEGGGSRGGP